MRAVLFALVAVDRDSASGRSKALAGRGFDAGVEPETMHPHLALVGWPGRTARPEHAGRDHALLDSTAAGNAACR